MPDRDRTVEQELRAAIADGDPASRLVYDDLLAERGEVSEEVGDDPTGPFGYPAYNGAAPHPRDEMFRGVWLYERLSHLVGQVRHNPTNTTWVFGYRGLWRGVPVMVFRPGDWLLTARGRRSGDAIVADLGERALHSEQLPDFSWAMIEAPPGVRLRALTHALTRTGEGMPDDIVVALVAQTRALLKAERGGGDTFVRWDGALWLSPSFPRCWSSEYASVTGYEVYDALVLDTPDALCGMFSAMPRNTRDEIEALRALLAGGPARPTPAPALLGPVARGILEALGPSRDPELLWARCAAAERASSERCASVLAAALRRHFGDAYDRQRVALRSVGLDIDQPWMPRRQADG